VKGLKLSSVQRDLSSMITMVVDFTDGWFPVACCESTAEQGPSQYALGHDYFLMVATHLKPRRISTVLIRHL
jgi:hypothetical protein